MATYPLPLAELLDPRHTAVLVVDIQPLFTGMPLSPPPAEVLARLQRFLAAAQDTGVLRVFIRHVIPAERWTEVWQQKNRDSLKAALAPDSPVAAFAPAFEPQPGDATVVKERYSAFVHTDLEALLRERGIRAVVVAGLTTDVCVGSTARDAFQRDFHTVTLSDCCAEQTQARHEAALQTLAACFGQVCASDDVMAAWRTEPVVAAT
jgi:ureidoacrylate peracid hydrolase